ncbi:hypothetical protein RclHR1_01210009 [Rhizophagus clarus]|uniref:Thioesterase domain-containing protein n=1 Tax=Rhizophagus clarus TaxID=94130 RepID=A0A2Z6QLC7_9GLOM|nr:hypothetical protein RclHR1_01210009 [Rhizophagus clarus]
MASNIPIIIKSFLFILILLNIKSFPLAYHIRSIPIFLKAFKDRNADNEGKDIFQIVECKYDVLFDDLDSNLHMNNSSYNKVLDHARGYFLGTLFANIMWYRKPSIMQRSVLMVFDHEIPPFSNYSVHTRILTWDHKWLVLVSYFRLHKDNKIASLGISKCIFKEPNGKTIRPEEIFEASGYLKNESEKGKEEREKRRQRGMKFVEGIHVAEGLFDDEFVKDLNLKNKITAKL